MLDSRLKEASCFKSTAWIGITRKVADVVKAMTTARCQGLGSLISGESEGGSLAKDNGQSDEHEDTAILSRWSQREGS